MKLSLHKDLASRGWHTSILTTYSVDSAFYDSYVERRLRSHGVRNNILMADHSMLARSMNAFPESFTGAGSRYAVVPIKVAGAFHPKIHIRLGERKASLVLGSANVTGMGWGKNQEIATHIDWEQLSEALPDNEVSLQLIGRAYRYLKSWLNNVRGETIQHKIELAERRSPWLTNLDLTSGALELADGTLIDLMLDSGGNSPSILARFRNLLQPDEQFRLIVISPYWDVSLDGFRELRKTLNNPKTFVALNPKTNTFPVDVLQPSEKTEFVRLSSESSSKFVHAKIFIVQTEHWDHVLFGSANCSDDALGYVNGPSRNAEACVYRRYSKGESLRLLEIDLGEKIDIKDVKNPLPDNTPPSNEAPPSPGSLELHGAKIIWWPSAAGYVDGEAVEIAGETLLLQHNHSTGWHANFTGKVTHPLIGRIRYVNGVLSAPAIVHRPTDLKNAVPAEIDAKLRNALETAFNADLDLIELAAKVELIFPVDATQKGNTAAYSSHRNESENQTAPAVQYENESEFRAAMLAPATGRSRQILDSTVGMQDLFSLVVKGILPDAGVPSDDPKHEDEAFLAGDTEDDIDESIDENEDVSRAAPPATLPKRKSTVQPIDPQSTRTFTSQMVKKRRKTLVVALGKFEQYLDNLKADATISLSSLPVQVTFIFAIMRYGVMSKHIILDPQQKAPSPYQASVVDIAVSEPVFLLVFAEDSLGRNHDSAFVPICLRILMSIWTGPNPLGTRLGIHASHQMLPDDIFEMIVISRWALARVLISLQVDAGKNDEWRPSLAFTRLNSVAAKIYTATGSLGPIDSVAELNALRRQDYAFGFTEADTENLSSILRQLASSSEG